MAKSLHLAKIVIFTAIAENHGLRDFHDFLLSLIILRSCYSPDHPANNSGFRYSPDEN